jgi:hypothetical protein
LSEVDRLAKLLANNLGSNENITVQGDIISFDDEPLEQSGRSPRERVHRKERRYKEKKKPNNPVFATIVLLVTVEREEEYELYILSENFSALKEGERWWDISYVKSLPKYFTGTPWYAWGFYGFRTKGVFSGAEYGFVDSIPSREQFGFPSLLETYTLNVNQQLGISSPLFFDDNNPAPVTKVKASLTVTDLWFSGFFRDNYVEITHLYEDRYGTISFAQGREKFPDDWWIYPYFNHDVDINTTVSDAAIDVYRYAYSPDGSPIDFDSLPPDEYTTVTIPLYEGSPPIVDGGGNIIVGTSSVEALDETVVEAEWRRTDPETCEEITGDCVAENQTVEEFRDFGVATSWNISCFNNGNVFVEDGDTVLGTIAVSAMPVTLQWDEVPNGLVYKYEGIAEVLVEDVVSLLVTNLGDGDPGQARVTIVGSVDTFKSSPSAVENNPVTSTEILVTPPVTIVTESVNEFRWKWSSQSTYKEINANSYVTGSEIADGRDAGITITPVLRKRGFPDGRYDAFNIYNADPNDWIFSDSSYLYYYTISASFGAELRAYWESIVATPSLPCNFNTYTIAAPTSAEGYFALYFTETPIRVMNPYVCATGGYSPGLNSGLNNAKHRIGRGLFGTDDDSDYLTPAGHIRSRTARPYVLFNTGVKDYAPTGTDTLEIIASTDTRVTVNGTEYFYASSPTITTDYQTRIDWELIGGGTGSYTNFDLEYANLLEKYKLRVLENGAEIFKSYYDEVLPVRLEGTKNITEYKLSVHTATISFTRTFNGVTLPFSWYKRGTGTISIDSVTGDCHQEGKFVYDKITKEGKLGITTITEQDSDRDPEVLYKFIEPRNNGDEVFDEEVTPELSITYVHAGGKVYSAVHTADTLQEIQKPVTASPGHQGSHIGGGAKPSIEDSTSFVTIAAPPDSSNWELSLPPGESTKQLSTGTTSIGETLLYIGTFDSEPTNVGGSVWKRDDFSNIVPLNYEGTIEKGDGIQWSNHHEYFVPRERDYWGTNISGWEDKGKWLNGWEPINTVGLTGYLPSGEFRSLGLYHETNQAKLQYGIKGAIETVQGANREPLHFVFAYGGMYSVFGKVNNGLDDDDRITILKSPASNNLTQLLFNKEAQISNQPPYPAEHDLNLLMKAEDYTWGGFKNYICPYTPGLAVEVNGLSSQVPLLMYPIFPTGINTSGVESTFEIGIPFVDPEKSYSIAVNGTLSTQTGIDNASTLRSAFLSDLSGLPGVTIASTSTSITFTGQGLSVSVSGLDITIDADDEPTPNITATVYLPGINAPYSLEIDGTTVSLSLSNGMSKEAALDSLLNSLSNYETEEVDDRIQIKGVYEVKQTIEKEYNDLDIVQSVVATESTDRPWRETEIKWDVTPEVGVQTSTNLELMSTANVSKYLKYDDFDYSAYPYAKIEDTRIFSIHDAELLDEPQPNKLLDQAFIDNVEGEDTGEAIVVKYAKSADATEWKEITVQVKQIQSSWFGATRDKVNIIAIAPSVISTPGAVKLVETPIGIKEDYEEEAPAEEP